MSNPDLAHFLPCPPYPLFITVITIHPSIYPFHLLPPNYTFVFLIIISHFMCLEPNASRPVKTGNCLSPLNEEKKKPVIDVKWHFCTSVLLSHSDNIE
ncbi:hypothetical protein F4810DRAFT_524471 [Camillea tinctor]|nr:hypothetical protein F4810DRAFT_524471 [Camillea tinctor]